MSLVHSSIRRKLVATPSPIDFDFEGGEFPITIKSGISHTILLTSTLSLSLSFSLAHTLDSYLPLKLKEALTHNTEAACLVWCW